MSVYAEHQAPDGRVHVPDVNNRRLHVVLRKPIDDRVGDTIDRIAGRLRRLRDRTFADPRPDAPAARPARLHLRQRSSRTALPSHREDTALHVHAAGRRRHDAATQPDTANSTAAFGPTALVPHQRRAVHVDPERNTLDLFGLSSGEKLRLQLRHIGDGGERMVAPERTGGPEDVLDVARARARRDILHIRLLGPG